MRTVLLYLLLWTLELGVVALMASAEWVEQQIQQEQLYVSQYMGGDDARLIQRASLARFNRHFQDSGAVRASYDYFLPDRSAPQYGMEGLAPWAFRWMEGRLDAFWWMLYQGYYRAQLVATWWPLLLPTLAAVAIHGAVERAIRRYNRTYASPARFRAGSVLLLLFLMIPLFYFTLPIAIHPAVVPLWGLGLGAVVALIVANAQHRI